MKDLSKLKIAVVHDWLVGGGAEHVVMELHKMFPSAPIYTSYCSDEWQAKLDGKVVTGYLQNWPFSRLRKFLPLLRQFWFKRLDFSGFDLVISSSGNGEAKFVRVNKPAVHVCYCHSPTHFYWRHYNDYLARPSFQPKWLVRLGMKLLIGPLRRRDYQAAQKVDYFIANSSGIQADIKKYYNRDSVVIHPPVDVERFQKLPKHLAPRSGFITAGRLVPFKHTDILIRACTKLNLPLTVIGRGPELENLKQIAGPTVEFLGYVKDADMPKHFATAEAFLFAAHEDFGVTPVEAMATGAPVIAYKAGGALDYVIPGKTGLFFEKQTTDSIAAAIQKFDSSSFEAETIRLNAKQFSPEIYRQKMLSLINKLVDLKN